MLLIKLRLICITFGLSVLLNLALCRLHTNCSMCEKPQTTVRNLTETDNGKDSLLRPESTNQYGISSNIEHILEKTRSKIKLELLNYNFTYSGVQKLEDLLMESGGRPVRNVIISTWRSGSNFLGDLLNAMPSNFYHYEPLINYKNVQFRGSDIVHDSANKATRTIKNMLRCDFSGEKEYITFSERKQYNSPLKWNTRLWEACKYNKELCVDPDFLSKICRLFPFQSMKLVRYRLRLAKNIIENEKLNVKVVLLVRDPRGVMHSRLDVAFCKQPDCTQPRMLCNDMINDYIAAERLLQEYPDRFMVIRFEDLALNLKTTTLKLLKFLRLEPTKSFEEFLYLHTNVKAGNNYATFRVSRDIPFKWRNIHNFDYVEEIQDACVEAMDMWGYKLAHNASHMMSKDFYPVLLAEDSFMRTMMSNTPHSIRD